MRPRPTDSPRHRYGPRLRPSVEEITKSSEGWPSHRISCFGSLGVPSATPRTCTTAGSKAVRSTPPGKFDSMINERPGRSARRRSGRLPGARGFRLQAKPVDIEKPRPEWNPAGLADVDTMVETEARRLSFSNIEARDAACKMRRGRLRELTGRRRMMLPWRLGSFGGPGAASPDLIRLLFRPFVGPFDAATEEARRLIAYSGMTPPRLSSLPGPAAAGIGSTTEDETQS